MLLKNFVDLFLDSAPWLMLGLILAGLIKVFVPMAWMQKQLGGHGVKTVVKAALLGAPLPLCSCGVIPAAVGLRRSGASKAATTSFLVSTPETGVDSIAVSYVLLGPFMAIVRPIAAITSAVVAGLLVGRDDDDGKPASVKPEPIKPETMSKATSSCCASQAKSAETSVKIAPASEAKLAPSVITELNANPTQSSCCGSDKKAPIKMTPMASNGPSLMSAAPAAVKMSISAEPKPKSASCCAPAEPMVKSTSCCSEPAQSVKPSDDSGSCCASTQDLATELKAESVMSRVFTGLKYAANDLVRDTAIWLLVGLFFAALVQTYVPADFLAKWGDGILAMLVMVIVSVPMYICATASTPIAAGLLLAGVSPGAVLVFMMAGPATNIATLGVVTKELGKRALLGYLGGVLGVALLAGMLVNYLVDTFNFVVMPQIGEQHQVLPYWLVATSGIILALLMAKVVFEKIPRSWLRRSDCCS